MCTDATQMDERPEIIPLCISHVCEALFTRNCGIIL